MSRRVVSYSDIDDGGAPVASVSSPVAQVSSNVTGDDTMTTNATEGVDGRSGNGQGKRKRKGGKARQNALHKHARLSDPKHTDHHHQQHRERVHRDDPRYITTSHSNTWPQQILYAEGQDETGTDALQEIERPDGVENDEEFFDARSDSQASTASGSRFTDEGDEGCLEPQEENQLEYTNWKYDENGDPYDGLAASYVDDGESFAGIGEDLEDIDGDHTGVDEDSYEDEDSDEQDNSSDANFLVPDVDEFNRLWQAKHRGSPGGVEDPLTPLLTGAVLDKGYRPPIEVGGGGRMLTQSELWGPTAMTDAWTAAMQQFEDMHGLTRHLTETHSKASDVNAAFKEGAEEEGTPKCASALWCDAPGHDSLLAKQIQLDTQQILQLKAQRRQKPTTPEAPRSSTKVAQEVTTTASGNTSSAPAAQHVSDGGNVQTRVPSGKLPGNHAWKRAVKTVRNTPNSIGVSTICKHETDKTPTTDEKLLHEYWYAGYYAGLAQSQSQAPGTVPILPMPSIDRQ